MSLAGIIMTTAVEVFFICAALLAVTLTALALLTIFRKALGG